LAARFWILWGLRRICGIAIMEGVDDGSLGLLSCVNGFVGGRSRKE